MTVGESENIEVQETHGTSEDKTEEQVHFVTTEKSSNNNIRKSKPIRMGRRKQNCPQKAGATEGKRTKNHFCSFYAVPPSLEIIVKWEKDANVSLHILIFFIEYMSYHMSQMSWHLTCDREHEQKEGICVNHGIKNAHTAVTKIPSLNQIMQRWYFWF